MLCSFDLKDLRKYLFSILIEIFRFLKQNLKVRNSCKKYFDKNNIQSLLKDFEIAKKK